MQRGRWPELCPQAEQGKGSNSMGDSLRYQDCFEKRHMTCAVRKS